MASKAVSPSADEESTSEEPLIPFKEILERQVGTGRWQELLIGYMSVMWLSFPTFSMSMMLVGASPEFKCANGFDMNTATPKRGDPDKYQGDNFCFKPPLPPEMSSWVCRMPKETCPTALD